jgi:hypothetical protein
MSYESVVADSKFGADVSAASILLSFSSLGIRIIQLPGKKPLSLTIRLQPAANRYDAIYLHPLQNPLAQLFLSCSFALSLLSRFLRFLGLFLFHLTP